MALDSVATVVKNVLQKELGVLLDYGQDLETLSSNMTVINAALEDAEQQQFSNKTTMDWLQKLKDTAYELDDILEECAYHEAESEHEGLKCCGLLDLLCSSSLSSFHPNHCWFRYQTVKKMKQIMQKIDQIAEEKARFHSPETARERSAGIKHWRQTFSRIDEPQVYGRAEDRDKIVDFLVCNASHSEDLTLYPIVGQGGLGKTTLAKLIFNHPKVDEHFKPTIWVCVSEDFSLKRMLKAIIEAVSRKPSEDLDLEPLERTLHDMLKGKRYLLVLDDVWDHDQQKWQSLKSVLACGGKGASVLVTSRLQKVARSMKTTLHHALSKLSDSDCWKLFKELSFESDEEVPEDLENIGKQIVEKCGGVPLAAKALGSLMSSKRQKKEWLSVRDSKLWSLPEEENSVSVMPALRLSYLNLWVELRQCFSLCALFPKDTSIDKQFIVSLWMANGFISSNQTSDAEVIGENVVNELYWRSFFEDVERDEFGKITSFKLHDLIHDLAQSVAGEEVCCITDDKGVTAISKRTRHLSIYSEKSSVAAVKYLKTFIMEYMIPVVPPDVLKCYCLRVLKIRGLKELPSAVGRLKYLSYLDISEGEFETLPESLCELFNLEVLILDRCRILKRLPVNLKCLKSLQCLSLKDCTSLSSMPPEIRKLSCLKKISKYIVGKEEGFLLPELGQLNLQGELEIRHLERVKSVRDAEEANMRNKHLNELRLSWDSSELQENVEEILGALQPHSQELQILGVVGYRGKLFPEWMSSLSLTNLNSLTLWACGGCLNLSGMRNLPSLKRLVLAWMDEVQYLENESYDGRGFIALESLQLWGLRKLKKLSREDGANMFPILSKLEISYCGELLDLPCLPSLKDLEINGECKEDLLSAFHKLPTLQSLQLFHNRELTCFPDGMLRNLSSLKTLRISSFYKLKSLTDEVFIGLQSLRTLHISNCIELKLSTGFRYLTCLEHLKIDGCDAVENLQLQDMTSLKSLRLRLLLNLESFPDCFGNLPLLRELTIEGCFKLRCLSTSFQCLTSLEKLWIRDCPELEKR